MNWGFLIWLLSSFALIGIFIYIGFIKGGKVKNILSLPKVTQEHMNKKEK